MRSRSSRDGNRSSADSSLDRWGRAGLYVDGCKAGDRDRDRDREDKDKDSKDKDKDKDSRDREPERDRERRRSASPDRERRREERDRAARTPPPPASVKEEDVQKPEAPEEDVKEQQLTPPTLDN